jgi:hypothetical protein
MSTKHAHRVIIPNNLATLTEIVQGSPGGGLAEAFPISGQIDPKAFPFLVVQLHRRGATGSLKVEGPSYHKAVYFRSGRVLFGSSNDPRDQLGAILIESGKITPEQLADVNAKVGPGNPLAKVLSDTGFVSQRELSEAARAKVERILSDVLAYTGGTFNFEDGVLPKGAVDLKLATERLVMAAVRRVGDRNFVLRHIDGLDAILGPTADMVPRLGEVEGETGGLPQHLDGRRTLKEAAAAARLEEFEAAKVACGLLFLGLAERVPAAVSASAVAGVTFADVDSGNELDLGATAAQAFGGSAPMVVPIVEPEPIARAAAAEEEPPAFVAPEPEVPSFDFSAPDPSDIAFETPPRIPVDSGPAPEAQVEPQIVTADESPTIVDAAPAALPVNIEPEPVPEDRPTVAIAPPAPTPDHATFPVTTADSPLPLVMPDRNRSSSSPRATAPRTPAFAPDAAPSAARSVASTRPSKEDLAALDDLLNSRSMDEPLAPLEKGIVPDKATYPRSGGGRRVRSSRLPIFAGVGVVLVALGAAAWLYRDRLMAMTGRATPASPAVAAVPSPMVLESPVAALPTQSVPSTTLAAVVSSPVAPVVPPVAATTPAPPVAAAHPDARALLRAGNYPDAARAFAKAARGAGRGAAVIQLFVACSAETVQKAVDNAGGTELLILPVNFKGRDCYRLGWGLYPSSAQATAAVGNVPEYFRTGGAAPKVLAVSEALP